ncbi:MAG: DsbE family thiol:disulfide interchange protein [Psychrobacter sp.]|nr:DsbE family thiol:disulfide interchange protein [Psychrobacter sp.]
MDKKQLKLWFLIPLIVFAGMMIMLYLRLGQPSEIQTNTALERPVPSFELPLVSDTSRSITEAQLPQKPYLLNIWGSWCPTCIVEHPFLLDLKSRGVDIVGVNYKDDIGDALNYLNGRGDPYLLSIQDKSGQFALDLGLTGAPETFVVDSKGIIRQHIIGEVNEVNWQERIAPCFMALNEVAQNNGAASVSVAEACR